MNEPKLVRITNETKIPGGQLDSSDAGLLLSVNYERIRKELETAIAGRKRTQGIVVTLRIETVVENG